MTLSAFIAQKNDVTEMIAFWEKLEVDHPASYMCGPEFHHPNFDNMMLHIESPILYSIVIREEYTNEIRGTTTINDVGTVYWANSHPEHIKEVVEVTSLFIKDVLGLKIHGPKPKNPLIAKAVAKVPSIEEDEFGYFHWTDLRKVEVEEKIPKKRTPRITKCCGKKPKECICDVIGNAENPNSIED